jgi:hypothetical protein
MTVDTTETSSLTAHQFAACYLNARLVVGDVGMAARLADSLAKRPDVVPEVLAAMTDYARGLREADPDVRLDGFTATYPDKPVVPHVDVHVDVHPADVTILPTEPKTRVIERDKKGEIVAVHEEP